MTAAVNFTVWYINGIIWDLKQKLPNVFSSLLFGGTALHMRSSGQSAQRHNAVWVMMGDESVLAFGVVGFYGRDWWDCIHFDEVFLMELRKLNSNVPFSLSSFSALNLVYQRNGDGEAKSPARRAGVCEAVLHTVEQGTRLPSQVGTVMTCDVHVLHAGTFTIEIVLSTRFYGRNSSYVHGGLDPSGKLAEAVYGQAVGAVFNI